MSQLPKMNNSKLTLKTPDEAEAVMALAPATTVRIAPSRFWPPRPTPRHFGCVGRAANRPNQPFPPGHVRLRSAWMAQSRWCDRKCPGRSGARLLTLTSPLPPWEVVGSQFSVASRSVFDVLSSTFWVQSSTCLTRGTVLVNAVNPD